MNKVAVAKELVKIAKSLTAGRFDSGSEEAMTNVLARNIEVQPSDITFFEVRDKGGKNFELAVGLRSDPKITIFVQAKIVSFDT